MALLREALLGVICIKKCIKSWVRKKRQMAPRILRTKYLTEFRLSKIQCNSRLIPPLLGFPPPPLVCCPSDITEWSAVLRIVRLTDLTIYQFHKYSRILPIAVVYRIAVVNFILELRKFDWFFHLRKQGVSIFERYRSNKDQSPSHHHHINSVQQKTGNSGCTLDVSTLRKGKDFGQLIIRLHACIHEKQLICR